MQNILISTIRFGAVAVLALTVFAGEAFAAPVLTPVTVSSISEVNATFTAKVANPGWKTTAVWFEMGETPNPTIAVGMRDVFNEGFFVAYPYDLKPDTTYYVRAAAMEGGVTAYSTVTSFKTLGAPKSVAAGSVQMAGVTLDTNTQAQTNSAATNASANTNAVSAPKKEVSGSAATANQKQKAADIATANTANGALVIGANGVFPQTLIGWVTLFIALLVLVLIARMVYESFEDRKRAREEAKKKEFEGSEL